MERMKEEAVQLEDYLVEMRHTLHQNPELGFEEVKTTALIKEELQSMGVKILPLPLQTGVVGVTGTEEGPTIALRADIDALPLQEKSGLPYASQQKGVMHACGHDGHTAILLGAARLLSSHSHQLKGRVLFLFQPAEETLFGACKIIETGVLTAEGVSRIVGLHGSPLVPLGKMGFLSGPAMAAADKFTVTVTGKGGHGAYPHQALDPVTTAAQVITALQTLVSREMNPLDPVVLSICRIQGGAAFNIIPEQVSLSGTLRSLHRGVQETIASRMERIISCTASACGCTATLDYVPGVPVLYNDPLIIEEVIESTAQSFGEEVIYRMEEPFMGSEDFAFFLEEVPGVYLHLGLMDTEKEQVMLHHPSYDFHDGALTMGAGVLASLAWDYLS